MQFDIHRYDLSMSRSEDWAAYTQILFVRPINIWAFSSNGFGNW